MLPTSSGRPTIAITSASGKQWNVVRSGSSYASQSDLALVFGLGQDPVVKSIEVTWPSGTKQKFANVPANQFITIDETPIGIFLELEGAPEWIDQTAARLGYPPAKYLTCSYASLYKEFRLAHVDEPENMTFPGEGLSRTPGKHT